MNKENSKDQDNKYDPVTNFMFGRAVNRKASGDTDNAEEPYFAEKEQQADDWFIGNRRHNEQIKEKNGSSSTEIPLMDLLNGVDIEKLADNIDTLMTTASQFKPLIKQVTPMIKKWIK